MSPEIHTLASMTARTALRSLGPDRERYFGFDLFVSCPWRNLRATAE